MISGSVDLHTHSSASDGSLSPHQLVDVANKIGLQAISITDHDTVEGSVEALDASAPTPLEVLPGVEISADLPSGGMHILGYLISFRDPQLIKLLGQLQEGRRKRNREIVARLIDLGVGVTYEEVLETAKGGQVGRPHFAELLVHKGVVHSFDEAFGKYLGKGRPAYRERFRPRPAEAIQAIRTAGGVAVLAHPYTVERADPYGFEGVVKELHALGLQGLEVYYPDHDPQRTAAYERLAHRYGLVATGGTDFHGRAKSGIHLGVGRGDLRVPYCVVEAIKACRK